MHLGFIGTGQITKAVITGIIASKIKIKKIYISNRNKKVSKYLKTKSKKIFIIQDNQEILDKSKWIFLAVTPSVGNKIIKNLKFKETKVLILNSNKAYNKLNWKTFLNLNELSFYITEWYLTYFFKKKEILNITLNQIKKYEKKVFKKQN